jgi:hypothetical protein
MLVGAKPKSTIMKIRPLLLAIAFVAGLMFAVPAAQAQILPKELKGTRWQSVSEHAQVTIKFVDAKNVSLSYDDEDEAIDWNGTYTATAGGGFSASFTNYEIDSADRAGKGKGTLKITGKYYLSEKKKPVMQFSSMTGEHAYMLDFLPAAMVLDLTP